MGSLVRSSCLPEAFSMFVHWLHESCSSKNTHYIRPVPVARSTPLHSPCRSNPDFKIYVPTSMFASPSLSGLSGSFGASSRAPTGAKGRKTKGATVKVASVDLPQLRRPKNAGGFRVNGTGTDLKMSFR